MTFRYIHGTLILITNEESNTWNISYLRASYEDQSSMDDLKRLERP